MLLMRKLELALLAILCAMVGVTAPHAAAFIQEPATCTVTATYNVNLRHGPSTDFEIGDVLSAGETAEVDRQITAADGHTWYHLTRSLWVREDVVNVPDDCASVPVVTAEDSGMFGVEVALIEDEIFSQWIPRPQALVPPEWLPREDGVARYLFELEAVINILQYCPYSGGRTLVRRRVDARANIVDLLTGEVLGSEVFQGEQPRACSTLETFREGQFQKSVTGGPNKKAITDWFFEVMFTHAEFPSALPVLSGYEFVDAHYSPDQALIVTMVDGDSNAYVWRADNSQRLFELPHLDDVNYAEFSPDSRLIITASEDQMVRLWDAQTGEDVRLLFGHAAEVYSASFSSDGQRAVSGGADKIARVWDINTGDEVLRLIGHEDIVVDARFSPDDRFIVTASADNTARVWDAETGEEVRVLAAHDEAVIRAVYCSDQYIATASYDDTVKLWDIETGELLQDFSRSSLQDFDCSADGQHLLTAEFSRVYMLDSVTGEELLEIQQPERHGFSSASFSPDGNYILTACASSEVARVWDTSSGDAGASAP